VFIFLVFCVVPPNTTTQKTKKMSTTDPTKYNNTENKKDEHQGPHQIQQHRKLKR
jgi:hypothetical protein